MARRTRGKRKRGGKTDERKEEEGWQDGREKRGKGVARRTREKKKRGGETSERKEEEWLARRTRGKKKRGGETDERKEEEGWRDGREERRRGMARQTK